MQLFRSALSRLAIQRRANWRGQDEGPIRRRIDQAVLVLWTLWLHYHVEYEAFSRSGRWFRAPIRDEKLAEITPETAVRYIEEQEWHIRGGSHFSTSGEIATGRVYADLLA